MTQTILDQIATNRALYDAVNNSNGIISESTQKAFASASMIENQRSGNSYAGGGSYGNFVSTEESRALDAAVILQDLPRSQRGGQSLFGAGSKSKYSYAGGSYGNFIGEQEGAMRVAKILDGGAGSNETQENTDKAPKESGLKAFLQKYKLWIIAVVASVVAYFVWRKK